jgi:hypothetical protein
MPRYARLWPRRSRPTRGDRGRLERRQVVQREGFPRLAEVVDERKPIDDLRRVRCSPAHALSVQVAPLATADRERRGRGQPPRDRRRRAIGQQVHDAVICEIDHDRAVAVSPPSGPLVDPGGVAL